jgi:hypothetical protein
MGRGPRRPIDPDAFTIAFDGETPRPRDCPLEQGIAAGLLGFSNVVSPQLVLRPAIVDLERRRMPATLNVLSRGNVGGAPRIAASTHGQVQRPAEKVRRPGGQLGLPRTQVIHDRRQLPERPGLLARRLAKVRHGGEEVGPDAGKVGPFGRRVSPATLLVAAAA